MKAKHLLYLAVIIGLLVPAIALPVMAQEEEIPMWVHRARSAYTGRSPHGPDAMVTFVHIRDANLDMVEGASVTAQWTLPDGAQITQTVVTSVVGIAEFSLWEGRGVYQLCVLDVTKPGWLYDPAQDRETCPVFTLP
jgi:hypothetical protein